MIDDGIMGDQSAVVEALHRAVSGNNAARDGDVRGIGKKVRRPCVLRGKVRRAGEAQRIHRCGNILFADAFRKRQRDVALKRLRSPQNCKIRIGADFFVQDLARDQLARFDFVGSAQLVIYYGKAGLHDIDLDRAEIDRNALSDRILAVDHVLVRHKILRCFSGLADAECRSGAVYLVGDRVHDQHAGNALCGIADVLVACGQSRKRQG